MHATCLSKIAKLWDGRSKMKRAKDFNDEGFFRGGEQFRI